MCITKATDKATHCMISTDTLKKQNYRDSKKICGCQGLRGRRDK